MPYGFVGALTTIFVLIWIAVTVFVSVYAQKARKKMIAILDVKCWPDLFLEKIQKIIKSGWMMSQDKYLIQLWKSVGLIEDGRVQEAYENLMLIDYIKLQRHSILSGISYMQILYSINLKKNNLKEAESNFRIMEELAQQYNGKVKYLSIVNTILEQSNYQMKFAKKEYERCKIYFFMIYQNKLQSMRMRVHAAYTLGMIVEAENIKIEAEKFYDFVTGNGNGLEIVQCAKSKINNFLK